MFLVSFIKFNLFLNLYFKNYYIFVIKIKNLSTVKYIYHEYFLKIFYYYYTKVVKKYVNQK